MYQIQICKKFFIYFISKSVFSLNAVIEGGSAKCWRRLTRGGGGVRQLLTIADEGGRGGLKTSEIGWRNMWTAPYFGWLWQILRWIRLSSGMQCCVKWYKLCINYSKQWLGDESNMTGQCLYIGSKWAGVLLMMCRMRKMCVSEVISKYHQFSGLLILVCYHHISGWTEVQYL